MARAPKDTDFEVSVENIGTFTFARRKMSDEIAIQQSYAEILGGAKPTNWLDLVATWISTFKVLTVFAPSIWNIEEMDPLEQASYDDMKRVYDALSEKELSFRKKPGAVGEGNSAPAL